MAIGLSSKEFTSAPSYSYGNAIFAIPGVGLGYPYSDEDDFAATPAVQGVIMVRLIGHEGAPIREVVSHGPLPENHFRTASADLPFDAAASATGRFVVVANEQIYDADPPLDASPQSVLRMQIHNADGSPVGGLATIGNGGGTVSNVDVEWISATRFAITWVESETGSVPVGESSFNKIFTEEWRVMTAVYDENGVEVRTPSAVEENIFIRETQRPYDGFSEERQTGRQIEEPRIVPLQDGGYAILYKEMAFQAFNDWGSPFYRSTLKLQQFDTGGNAMGAPLELETYPWDAPPVTGTPSTFLPEADFFQMSEVDAVQLDNGNLLILYSALDPDWNTSGHVQASHIVYVSVRGLDGSTVLETTPVAPYATDEVGSRVEPRLEKMADGRVFGVFSQTLLNSSRTEGFGMLFDKDGAILLPKFDLSAPGEVPDDAGADFDAYDLPGVQAAVLDDGQIAVTGTLSTVSVTGDNLLGIFHLTDEITGTPDGDFLVGGASYDTIIGLGGVDTLVGGVGDDLLNGGPVADPATQGNFMFGGKGDDTYIVQNTFDLVDEGYAQPAFGFGGHDTIISGATWYWDVYGIGETLIIDEAATDPFGTGTTIVAGVFDNVIVGNSGTNILFGRGGSDTYRAGDGIDFISLSLMGVPENLYEGIDGPNTVVVDKRTSGFVSYDIVFEFEPGKDFFDLSSYNIASHADLFARAFDDGAGSSYFILGDGLDYLYVVGLEKLDLGAGDFIL